LTLNDEVLDDYAIVNKDPNMNLATVTVSGSISVNYFGFTQPGYSLFLKN